jgi:RNA polymerase sigma-70 factor (ECF subfamily)
MNEDQVETSFRREYPRLVSVLIRAFGTQHLDLIEDAIQETFARAVQHWGIKGTPENPPAWLVQVAKRITVDLLRREGLYTTITEQATDVEWSEPRAFQDPEIELLFLCCNPAIPLESQIALTLRELCGLSTKEVAKSLLLSEDATAQRVVRGKHILKSLATISINGEATSRLPSVHHVLYLLFNEGYASYDSSELVRGELCDEAILLTNRLLGSAAGQAPSTHALLALMLLHSSRLPARLSPDGAVCLLEEQDRTLWDRGRISAGMRHLATSARGSDLTQYHYEAGIAAAHAMAGSFQDTDWESVLSNYDGLAALSPSPVILLNRAVALSMVHGPELGLEQIAAVEDSRRLQNYYLLPACKAKLLEMSDRRDEALLEYERAVGLATNASERLFLQKKLAALTRQET